MMSWNSRFGRRFSLVAVTLLLLSTAYLLAQTTVGTGSIVGTVTDPSGAVVSGAKVTIANTSTGQTVDVTTNAAGAYNSGALAPGQYKVQVSAKGFSSLSTTAAVLVGNTSTVNGKLQLGQESQVIEVQANAVAVNTEQAAVQGVINTNQIENLPLGGRNFLRRRQRHHEIRDEHLSRPGLWPVPRPKRRRCVDARRGRAALSAFPIWREPRRTHHQGQAVLLRGRRAYEAGFAYAGLVSGS